VEPAEANFGQSVISEEAFPAEGALERLRDWQRGTTQAFARSLFWRWIAQVAAAAEECDQLVARASRDQRGIRLRTHPVRIPQRAMKLGV
jgi:hypothetical protein